MLTPSLEDLATEIVENEIKSLVETVATMLAEHVRATASPDELESISQHMANFTPDEGAEPVYRFALAFARVAVFKGVVRAIGGKTNA